MTAAPPPSTRTAVSPDSGEHWSAPGAWQVADGLYRIPLPLPMDGLRAVNVYVLEPAEESQGLTLIDGGWAITAGREALEAGLARIGRSFGDIRRFLVTHMHRDHYSLAAVLGTEYGAEVALGSGEKPALDLLYHPEDATGATTIDQLRAAGAHDLAVQFGRIGPDEHSDPRSRRYPDIWLTDGQRISASGRTLDAIHTPGHTQGHFVFADHAAGILFAGDHVLPTITPSIGFEPAAVQQPLRDFMASLARVRALPDLQLLPAHGPIAESTHARADQLLAHHEQRLDLCRALLGERPVTSLTVANGLPWTRHEHPFSSLDVFNASLAVMETKAHLELLVARGQADRTVLPDGIGFSLASSVV